MTTRIQLRRGTAAQWTDADPTLALGEAGIETDTLLWKVGDGVTSWSELPYMESADKNFGNVTVTGNITTGNIKTNGYYFANGTPVPFGVTYGNSNVASFLAAYGSNTIGTTGNVTSGNFLTSGVVSATGNITAGNIGITGSSLTWANASIVQTSASDVSITGDGQVTVRSLDGTYQWTFESTGNLTLPGATAGETIATQGGYITVGNLLVGQGGALFNSNNDSWALYGNISDPGATIFIPSNADAGNGTPLYIESQQSNVEIRSGSSTWNFDTTGNLTVPNAIIGTATILIDNRASGNSADIQLYSADDIVLQARDRTLGSGTEGGDINIYAGDSAEDGDTSGGDIQIRAGDGGAGNVDIGGSGGTITIQSGRGGAAIGNTDATAESGGSLTLSAGDAGDNNGNIDLGSDGGDVYIESGFSTGNTNNGGDIYLTTGTGGQNGASGIVQVNIPGYGLTTGGTWTFDPNGQINIPADSNSFGTGRIQSANGYPTLLGYGSGEHGGPELDWTDGNDPTDIGNASVLRNTLYINDGGLYVGMNENNVANTFTGGWRFNPNGTTIFPTLEVDLHNGGVQTGQVLQFGDTGQQAIITGPAPAVDTNAQRLIIQGQVGNGTGEGGDVYLWAGDAQNNGGDIKIYAGDADNASAGSGGYVNIDGGAGFDDGGAITLTGGTSANGTGGTVNIDGGYGNIGGNVGIQAGYGQSGPGGAVTIIGGGSANGLAEYGNVTIGTGASEWKFDNTGNLTLPGGTFAVNYANGSPVVISGGSGNTGNVTFDNNIVIGTGDEYGGDGLFLATGPNGAANLQYLRLRGGDFPTHIHLDTGNNAFYDQYFGNDNKFVKLEAGDVGNVVIGTDDATGNLYNWTFTSDGNLILANGNSVIKSIANSSLDPLNPNVSTMVLTPDPGYSSQSLVLDPTAPGHIHLRAPGANIDEPSANIFLGGETSSFEVGYHNGAAPNLFIHSGNNTWTFDNAGNLTLPGNTFAINYANGTQVSIGGGGANTGNVTFNDINIIGTGNLKLQPDSANADAYLDIYLTSGPDIHIAGNGETVILGTDDFANVAVNVDGNVSIQSGNASGTHTWNFDTAGNLTLPRGGIVYETNIPDGGLNGNTIALAPSGGTNADQQLLIYPTVTDANHLHLTSGNLYNTELYLGSDDLYVKLANTGNIIINTNDNVGNTHQWSFDYLGTMYIPGNIKVTPNNDLDVKLYNANASSNVAFTVQNRQVDLGSAVTTQFDVAGNSIVLSTDVNTNNYQWTFDDTGNLTAPGVVTASEFSTSGSGGDITMSSGNITGANVVSANTVSSTGNVTGVYIKGNGSELTNLPAPVVTQDITSNGAMSIMTYDGNIKYASYATVEPSSGNIAGGNISTSGNVTTAGSVVTTPIALANLTAVAGGRAFVNNGNLAAVGNFGAQIGSGGSNIVPVWSDGTNWYIG